MSCCAAHIVCTQAPEEELIQTKKNCDVIFQDGKEMCSVCVHACTAVLIVAYFIGLKIAIE
jgi:hypothetical protein